MLALLCNVLIVVIMTGTIGGGVALFWIASQDGSPTGRTLGAILVVATLAAAGYLTAANLWF
jgi:hypothetical protein